jgi:sulfotransferase
MEKIHFLCGMQRSGSTLLACLFNQHPDIHATATSPLVDLAIALDHQLNFCNLQYTFDYEKTSTKLFSSLINSFHGDIKKPIILDKGREWMSYTSIIKKYTDNPKIICPNRSVPEIITSFIKLIENNNTLNNFIDKSLRSNGIPITINNRADYIFNEYVSKVINYTNKGLEECRDCIHIVEYNDLMSDPQDTMNKIYDFLEVESFNHNFDNIENTCEEEKDEAWGIENLHIIRNKLQKTSTPPEEVLGKELTEYYRQFDIKYS